jgi:hypothetical protein
MDTNNKNPEDVDSLFDSNSPDETKDYFLESIAKFCDRCGTSFNRESVNIVKRAAGQVLLHIKCAKCSASYLASFIRQMGISSRTPFQTDLTIDELKVFSSFDAVSSNEVLDVHDYVNSQKDISADVFLKLLSKAEVAESSEDTPNKK